METSKQKSSQRQTETAIRLFHDGEYDSAITLAAAAEGMLPSTNDPHLFQALRDHESYPDMQYNLIINWLKHSNSPETRVGSATIDEFEVSIVLARAITKFIAVYHVSCKPFEDFLLWGFEAGHLPRLFK